MNPDYSLPASTIRGIGLVAMAVVALAAQGTCAEVPPSLAISTSGGNIQVCWPASATDWMLCANPDLASGEWTLVSAVPAVLAGQNVVTLPAAAKGFYQLRHRGAVVPFTTLEAEDTGSATGSVIRMTTPPTGTTWTPEMEASGRGFVQLSNTGDRLDFTNTVAANALVIRHCIPDAPAGSGITATLSLYVNDVFRQKLTLSSKHNWLYGNGTQGSNGNSNDPTFDGATPHAFWDEERAFIAGGGLEAGDTLRLQKDADDTADYYRIDLVDLEAAPPPLSPPPAGTWLPSPITGRMAAIRLTTPRQSRAASRQRRLRERRSGSPRAPTITTAVLLSTALLRRAPGCGTPPLSGPNRAARPTISASG